MKNKAITIATRSSPLALWQANFIAKQIQQLDPQQLVHVLPMVTEGDRAGPERWGKESGKGLFVKELEQAILDQRADLAVHSMKDVPATFPSGLGLAVVTERANPFDALISEHYASLDELPHGASVGTASLRRQAQLLKYRPDLKIQVIRGNVQTRLNKMREQKLDALILAQAGLERLNYHALIRETLTPPRMIPSCGQGVLGIECRLDDEQLLALLRPLSCPRTQITTHVERSISAALGGSCHVPMGTFCRWMDAQTLIVHTRILSPDGQKSIEHQGSKPAHESEQLIQETLDALMNQGAAALLAMI